MKDLEHKKETSSYMQLCLYLEGKGNIYLMIPTFWDEPHKQWMGFIQTPVTRRLIHATGRSSKELQDNFNVEISKALEASDEEVFSMFKPLEYWESRL